jgi:hypothetical protein
MLNTSPRSCSLIRSFSFHIFDNDISQLVKLGAAEDIAAHGFLSPVGGRRDYRAARRVAAIVIEVIDSIQCVACARQAALLC